MSSATLVFRYQGGRFDETLGRYLKGHHLVGYVKDGLVYRDGEDTPIIESEGTVGGGLLIGSVTEDGRLFIAFRGSPPLRGAGEEIGHAYAEAAYAGTSRDPSFEIKPPSGLFRTVYRVDDQGDYLERVEWGYIKMPAPYGEGAGTEAVGAVFLIQHVPR